ncbi:hypothetical protein C0992_007674 [Termitomyces sp. T32_za158]|nr:hypothetical protein C0992_007674 [Termitomyces sp. T32_za158]
MASLRYNTSYWEERIPGMKSASLESKLHLIFSLLIYLGLTIHQVLNFIFSENIKSVKDRASLYLAHRPSASDASDQFHPSSLLKLWYERWPASQQHLHVMIQPYAHKIVLAESNKIITDPSLQVRLKNLTISDLREILKPEKLLEKYMESAPFTFSLLQTFSASPNRYRKIKAQTFQAQGQETMDLEEDEMEDDPNLDYNAGGEERTHAEYNEWRKTLKGFNRNPVYCIVLTISMLAYVRNRATNVLPLLLGLFFKISGTSSRVMTMLSNTGVSVSGRTVERLKAFVSDDAIHLAVNLIKSGEPFYTIFDNINLFLRKFQQRLTNQNSMIHATNCAIVRLDGVNSAAQDLGDMLKLRGKRVHARMEDILPTREDDAHIENAFQALIAEILVRYCPGSKQWKDRGKMMTEIVKMMPSDRPLDASKTDARPFGVFDVNEGSKKGILEVLKEIQERSMLSEEEWSSKVRIIQGDWLTSSNLRAARRDRFDDVNSMERVEYVAELSALFHFALQMSHAIMRTHYGHAVRNPSCLAAHKGLLNRTWDVNKPNYAAAKSLIRHSLIARIIHCVMVKKNFTRRATLEKWRPTISELQDMASTVAREFTTSAAARTAQVEGHDDWMAHSIYFMRDSLFFCEFEDAVSHADPGRVIRVLKYWSLLFRGAGQHNYGRECAEVLVRWKYELTPAQRSALEKSWFVNRWGEKGRSIPADLYVEQLNFWIKVGTTLNGA